MPQLPVKGVPSKFFKKIIFRNVELINGIDSNITFGAGGKDKNGNSIPGWGYYEVLWDSADVTCLITYF
jgi:hypothetical protein